MAITCATEHCGPPDRVYSSVYVLSGAEAIRPIIAMVPWRWDGDSVLPIHRKRTQDTPLFAMTIDISAGVKHSCTRTCPPYYYYVFTVYPVGGGVGQVARRGRGLRSCFVPLGPLDVYDVLVLSSSSHASGSFGCDPLGEYRPPPSRNGHSRSCMYVHLHPADQILVSTSTYVPYRIAEV